VNDPSPQASGPRFPRPDDLTPKEKEACDAWISLAHLLGDFIPEHCRRILESNLSGYLRPEGDRRYDTVKWADLKEDVAGLKYFAGRMYDALHAEMELWMQEELESLMGEADDDEDEEDDNDDEPDLEPEPGDDAHAEPDEPLTAVAYEDAHEGRYACA
jgi:hypothetical protein